MYKTCKVCGEVKPLEEFYRSAGMRDGRRNDCKPCNLAAKARRYEANPEPEKARVKAWQQAHPDRVNESNRARRARPEVKAKQREAHLLRKFGITQAEYDAMLAEHGGGCALCGRPPTEGISLHVDHDHETGKVRGLLCFRHNNALGDFDDDPAMLLKAAGYLDLHSADPVVVSAVRARVAALPRWPRG